MKEKKKTVMSIEELDSVVNKVSEAQKLYSHYDQVQVDEIFRIASIRANEQRISLAKLAATETGMGIMEDKVIKNHFASEFIFHQYKDSKTCGIIEEDKAYGIKKIAEPYGVICAIIPTTNPTSTAIFKCLIALKTRNAVVISPHPRAKNATIQAARIIRDAAVEAGAPKDLIGWVTEPSMDLSNHLMTHPKINLILATGGPGMVKAAYSSGKPAIGVGAGNTPAVIDESADIKTAVSSILVSKTFDNGVICASEQSVIVHKDVYKAVKDEFKKRGAHILTKEQKDKIAKLILTEKGTINAAIVGQSAFKIAALAGFKVEQNAKVLIGEVTKTDRSEAFAHEKLSPILAMYSGKDFDEIVDKGRILVELGGFGHTSVLYTDLMNQDRINTFGSIMKTGRILINTPASQGAIGDLY
ncbi:MAG: aldehyde dehydrogenase family protein, partial [Spirochaetaceae bacterium]